MHCAGDVKTSRELFLFDRISPPLAALLQEALASLASGGLAILDNHQVVLRGQCGSILSSCERHDV